jgi:hypothetical protein
VAKLVQGEISITQRLRGHDVASCRIAAVDLASCRIAAIKAIAFGGLRPSGEQRFFKQGV